MNSGQSKENSLLTYLLGCLLNAGRVVRADIMTESSGRSKGCGTVLFETSEDAAHAISILLTCKCGLLQCMLFRKILVPLQMKGCFLVESNHPPTSLSGVGKPTSLRGVGRVLKRQ